MKAMQDKTGENISALVDGELGDEETRFLRRRLDNDPAARAQLSRYHAMSAALRGEYVTGAETMADRVRDALAEAPAHRPEEAPIARGEGRVATWLQPLAGLAIAASVALGVVTVWPLVTETPGTDEPTATAGDVITLQSSPAVGSVEQVAAGNSATRAGDETLPPAARLTSEQRRRLNAYFVNHSEHAATGQLGGTLKYARIVGHGSER